VLPKFLFATDGLSTWNYSPALAANVSTMVIFWATPGVYHVASADSGQHDRRASFTVWLFMRLPSLL